MYSKFMKIVASQMTFLAKWWFVIIYHSSLKVLSCQIAVFIPLKWQAILNLTNAIVTNGDVLVVPKISHF